MNKEVRRCVLTLTTDRDWSGYFRFAWKKRGYWFDWRRLPSQKGRAWDVQFLRWTLRIFVPAEVNQVNYG